MHECIRSLNNLSYPVLALVLLHVHREYIHLTWVLTQNVQSSHLLYCANLHYSLVYGKNVSSFLFTWSMGASFSLAPYNSLIVCVRWASPGFASARASSFKTDLSSLFISNVRESVQAAVVWPLFLISCRLRSLYLSYSPKFGRLSVWCPTSSPLFPVGVPFCSCRLASGPFPVWFPAC